MVVNSPSHILLLTFSPLTYSDALYLLLSIEKNWLEVEDGTVCKKEIRTHT